MFARDAETRLGSHVDRRNTPRARGVRSGGFFDKCASGGSAECKKKQFVEQEHFFARRAVSDLPALVYLVLTLPAREFPTWMLGDTS